MAKDDSEECAVCIDRVNINNVTLNCRHTFCNSCILFVRDKKCPLCRKHYNLRIGINKDYKKIKLS